MANKKLVNDSVVDTGYNKITTAAAQSLGMSIDEVEKLHYVPSNEKDEKENRESLLGSIISSTCKGLLIGATITLTRYALIKLLKKS